MREAVTQRTDDGIQGNTNTAIMTNSDLIRFTVGSHDRYEECGLLGDLLVNEVVPSELVRSEDAAVGPNATLTEKEGEELRRAGAHSGPHYHKARTAGWRGASCFSEQREPLQDRTQLG